MVVGQVRLLARVVLLRYKRVDLGTKQRLHYHGVSSVLTEAHAWESCPIQGHQQYTYVHAAASARYTRV
jgi:hypothetical protein